jgi:hypothetical protein
VIAISGFVLASDAWARETRPQKVQMRKEPSQRVHRFRTGWVFPRHHIFTKDFALTVGRCGVFWSKRFLRGEIGIRSGQPWVWVVRGDHIAADINGQRTQTGMDVVQAPLLHSYVARVLSQNDAAVLNLGRNLISLLRTLATPYHAVEHGVTLTVQNGNIELKPSYRRSSEKGANHFRFLRHSQLVLEL